MTKIELHDIFQKIPLADSREAFQQVLENLEKIRLEDIKELEKAIPILFWLIARNSLFRNAIQEINKVDDLDSEIIALWIQCQHILISNHLALLVRSERTIKLIRRSYILASLSIFNEKKGETHIFQYFWKLEEIFRNVKWIDFKNLVLIQIQLMTIRKYFQYWEILNNDIEKIEKSKWLLQTLQTLYKTYDHFKKWITKWLWWYENKTHEWFLSEYYNLFEDKNLIIAEKIIEIICKDFVYIDGERTINYFDNQVWEKLQKTISMVTETEKIGKDLLSAFKNGSVIEQWEWSNKIYINTFKLLWIFRWVYKVTDRNYSLWVAKWAIKWWIKDLHEVIYSHYHEIELNDDWETISSIIQQENKMNEWKEVFLLPNWKIDEKIPETILAMMNSEGGYILIGKPDKKNVADTPFQKIQRNGYVFVNAKKQLDEMSKNLDFIKRNIQDCLHKETKKNIHDLDDLWKLSELTIFDDTGNEEIQLFLIEVVKGTNIIPSVKNENWMTVKRRVNGRNEDTLPNFNPV